MCWIGALLDAASRLEPIFLTWPRAAPFFQVGLLTRKIKRVALGAGVGWNAGIAAEDDGRACVDRRVWLIDAALTDRYGRDKQCAGGEQQLMPGDEDAVAATLITTKVPRHDGQLPAPRRQPRVQHPVWMETS